MIYDIIGYTSASVNVLTKPRSAPFLEIYTCHNMAHLDSVPIQNYSKRIADSVTVDFYIGYPIVSVTITELHNISGS